MSERIISPGELERFFRYFRDEPHQLDAVHMLWQGIANSNKDLLRESAAWARQYREQPKPVATPGTAVHIPYFSQVDDGPDGWRLCQSASVAMCLAAVGFKNDGDDLWYVEQLKRHGDSTDQAAHARTLRDLGAPGRFISNCTVAQAKREIDAGRPVAVALLHHGSVSHPSGGHWIVLCGYDATGWCVCDPYGNLNLVTGQWEQSGGHSGDHIHYSFANMNPRWQVEGDGSGWAWVFAS